MGLNLEILRYVCQATEENAHKPVRSIRWAAGNRTGGVVGCGSLAFFIEEYTTMIWIAYDPMTKSTNRSRRGNAKDCIATDKDEPRVHSTAQHILYLLEDSIEMDNDLKKAA